MIKQIIGGVIVLVIGGTTYTISQKDVVNNYSNNAGVSQQQAQDYINNIKPSDLESFTKAGQSFIDDGNAALSASVDCENYTYQWESATLSCNEGKFEYQKVGRDEVALGNCLQALDTNLGSSAKSKMSECISDIDVVNSDYNFPIASALLDAQTISNSKNNNIYDKSVLQAALQSR